MDRVFFCGLMGLGVVKDGLESPLPFLRIVDRFGCVHNCKWLDVELNILGESRLLLFGSGNIYSALGNFELLPAEEAGIDRPGAGSDHREGGAKGR
jgi:hypothetical protein